MAKKILVKVRIPHPKPSLELPPDLADLLEALIVSGNIGATTRELAIGNIKFSPLMITKLRDYGVIISEENTRGPMLTYYYKGCL